ncbi:hypothetical protein [Actinosynnema sp. NPDC023587]|uniref:hypothetical protein n=1 Tax=Actinosynnema sp. NPDC023587 TaxID=3154695 RepID=UPI0033C7D8A6
MCRAGGRRCPNAGGRSTQNTRKGVSRARQALRAAKACGDDNTVATARERLAVARKAHQEAKNAMDHHEHDHTTAHDTPRHDGDVTAEDTTAHTDRHDRHTFAVHNQVTGTVNGILVQGNVIHGPIGVTVGDGVTADHDGDVTGPPRHRPRAGGIGTVNATHLTHIDRPTGAVNLGTGHQYNADNLTVVAGTGIHFAPDGVTTTPPTNPATGQGGNVFRFHGPANVNLGDGNQFNHPDRTHRTHRAGDRATPWTHETTNPHGRTDRFEFHGGPVNLTTDTDTRTSRRRDSGTGDDGDVTDREPSRRAERAARDDHRQHGDGRHVTRNVASGDDHVDQQIGFRFR